MTTNHSPSLAPLDFASTLSQLKKQFSASAARFDASGEFPYENFEALRRAGLLSLVASAPYGHHASLLQTRQAIESIAYGEPATALVLTMTYLNHHLLDASDNRWPATLKHRVLESASHGGLINALRVEPELGSPARGGLPQTVAVRTEKGWRLSGRKIYSTGSPALEWFAVWGRTDEPEPRTGMFLVHRPSISHGITIIENWNHLGLRASGSHEVVLDNVEIPFENAVDIRLPQAWNKGKAHTDLGSNDSQQAWMIVLLGTLYDAVAQAARDWLVQFLQTRVPASLGAPLSTLPRVQEHVGEIEARLATNRILLDHAAQQTDAGHIPRVSQSGLLKYTVTTNAIEAVEIAIKITGNHGLSRNNPLERHYRDVLCSRIHTPQNDSSLIAAGKEILIPV